MRFLIPPAALQKTPGASVIKKVLPDVDLDQITRQEVPKTQYCVARSVDLDTAEANE